MERQQTTKPTFFVKSFIAYIYFMQGVYLSLMGSIAYLYPVFPSTNTLSYFSIAALPFSFKYITAPIVEKFTIPSYGRRKFWIILSLLSTSLLSIPFSMIFTQQQMYKQTVAILFIIFLMISMGDIGVDAAAVKQLNDPVLAGYLQSTFQSSGVIIGGFLLIKLSHPTFWNFLGIQGRICTSETFMQTIAIVGLIITIILHKFYQQKVLADEQGQKVPEFKQIFKYYLHFVNPKYSLCRHVIFFLVFMQGIKCFTSSFGVEAIYRGFPKQRAAQLQIASTFVALAINTLLSRYITQNRLYNFIIGTYLIELSISIAIFLWNDYTDIVVVSTLFTLQILGYVNFLLQSTLINGFGKTKFAGLCLTTLASFSNFGRNSWLQLKLNSIFGYHVSVSGGLVYAVLMAFVLKHFLEWIRKGQAQKHVQKEHLKEN